MKNIIFAHFCALLVVLLANKPLWAQIQDQKRPVLSEFIQTIIETHPKMEEARALLKASQARAKGKSRPLYNPEMDVEYENSDINTSTIGLSQSIDWSGKRNAQSQVAMSKVDIALANLEITKQNLMTEVLMALSNHQIYLEALKLNQNKVKLGEQFLTIAKDRKAMGDLSTSELITARLSLAEAKVAFGKALMAIEKQHEELVSLTGEEREIWPILSGVPPVNNFVVSKDQIQNFPFIKLAKARTASYRSRITEAQKERSPDPTVGVKYGEEGSSNLFGVSFSIPLPVRNNYRAEVNASRADYLAAEKKEQYIFRNVTSRLKGSQRKYKTARKIWNQWNSEGETTLEEQKALLQKLLKNREIDTVSYLVQLQQTFNAQEASIASKGRVWSSWIELLEATNNLNKWMEKIQ